MHTIQLKFVSPTEALNTIQRLEQLEREVLTEINKDSNINNQFKSILTTHYLVNRYTIDHQ